MSHNTRTRMGRKRGIEVNALVEYQDGTVWAADAPISLVVCDLPILAHR